ncbi:MAG: hypothetical protein LUG85_02900 [Clostridiales bacterium]|nr:hypothetical protein [Clostridiales bacterium]MCD7827469.1 hypothetical protein [Clostridiales bacterium]
MDALSTISEFFSFIAEILMSFVDFFRTLFSSLTAAEETEEEVAAE